MISESSNHIDNLEVAKNVTRSGEQTRILVQQINNETKAPIAHFVVSDVQTKTVAQNPENGKTWVVNEINETLVFRANATGEIICWTEVVGSSVSNIPDTMRLLEKHLQDTFDDLPF